MYKSLSDCIIDLEKNDMIIRISTEVDPNLEMAEIHRRIYNAGGPAILFEKVKGSPFKAVSNIYGTFERTEFIFRNTLSKVKKVIELKADPSRLIKRPLHYLGAGLTAITALPLKSLVSRPVKYGQTTIDQLPLIKSWPSDGGAFITLPQVLTLPPYTSSIMQSNVGMYRVQLNGNEYDINEEVGMHYQIHRGIGVHHTMYNRSDQPFRCSIFVGGPPSHAFAAIMPMPEGISELTFAGMLAGRRFRYFFDDMGHVVSSDADFVITGTILKNVMKPEGPFGDHLGYYSLQHDFPVMKIDRVYHRKNPLWHFTVVGRPPQEDSSFGHLIHLLVKELTPQEFPGLVSLNAVDAAGVHPLLIAIGKERYMPFRERKPEEILTIANRILGSGQTSLAKYLWIAAEGDDPQLNTHDIRHFFHHMLERVDWKKDLHFYTCTTIDTLDYSGTGWNAGSKVVVAACGKVIRTLESRVPEGLKLPQRFGKVELIQPGILAMEGPSYTGGETAFLEMEKLTAVLKSQELEGFPLIILCDDSRFISSTLNNFLWVTFTRSNPSHDIYGIGAFVEHKHWGCHGSLIIDARIKSHHAPLLETDPAISKKVDQIFSKEPNLRELNI
ncbi:MAG TPA: UbiD family decarboxylase [Saprospiraceae bacterium]|nr:UbiD family decarboxylase [Saprospiraceae bacterium]